MAGRLFLPTERPAIIFIFSAFLKVICQILSYFLQIRARNRKVQT